MAEEPKIDPVKPKSLEEVSVKFKQIISALT